ncbi:MAG: hypothetical protein A2W93_06645 [Bacteroidetes bacterium GWF2_43_63]|nr:MAG: hypothetical protein A2W94_07890 [Bacteroidetes bacterium GWE2_42_42]OFY53298.1 MAG: hypothetical protein A2W93_06645 [Bacteroidetes bacterium GWF2_43_63]HBG71708.1 hypothetical protein [Bacteroidales bacterium]HCB61627.1 hypothetical protein [Bacteroidales bacterium]HCY22839.1 hypothetical protein [Bacteroidales bacterium]
MPFVLFSQVQLVSSDATKFYPDDTRITYMQLSQYPVDVDFLKFIELEVLSNTSIQRFVLSKDGKTCFFQAQKDINEEMIVEAINDAYHLYFTTQAPKLNEEVSDKPVANQGSNDFKERGVLNDYYICWFTLDMTDDNDLVKDIISVFKESDFISDVNYNGNSSFEVYSKGTIYPDEIEALLEKWGITIQKESLK